MPWHNRTSLLGLLVIFILTACGGGSGGGSEDEQAPILGERQIADQPDLYPNEYQVHIIYAIPQDQPDEQLDINGKIAGSLASSNAWFETASGGKRIRYDMTVSAEHDITFLQLPDLDADYASNGNFIRDAIEEDVLAAGFTDPFKLYAVYYGGSSSEPACGLGPPVGSGDPVVILILKGEAPGLIPCSASQFSSAAAPARYWEWTLAHEIVHGLGFVDPCASNFNDSNRGHTTDDPEDLMYAGPGSGFPTTIDVNQDDYYGANVPAGCARNLFFSAFLEPRDGDQIPVNFHH